jgi:hypothetical protein
VAYERGVALGLGMANLATEYHMRERPMNGDGSNTVLKAVQGSIKLLEEKSPSERAETLGRYMDLISRRAKRVSRIRDAEKLTMHEAGTSLQQMTQNLASAMWERNSAKKVGSAGD